MGNKSCIRRWGVCCLAAGLLTVGLAGQVMADYAGTIAGQNPLFYWRLNDTALGTIACEIDNSATADNDGLANVTSSIVVADTSGNQLTPTGGFDGFDASNVWMTFPALTTGDFIQHLTNPKGEMSSTLGSVTQWIKTTTGPTTGNPYGTLYRIDQGATGASYTFIDNTGKFGLRITNAAGEAVVLADVRSTNAYNDGNWHHVAATWDELAGIATIYIDGGAAAGGETVIGAFADGDDYISSNRHRLGKGTNDASRYQGSVDELAIWTSAISAADVQAQYQSAFMVSYHPGDANGDGMVNLADLQILGDNWQSTTATWAQADFTGDGNVNLADLQILGDNWGFGVGADISFDEALAGVVIPEPATAMLLGLGGLLAIYRRR